MSKSEGFTRCSSPIVCGWMVLAVVWDCSRTDGVGRGRYKASTPHVVLVDASLLAERLISLRRSAEKILQHRVYSGCDYALDQVLGVESTNCPCDI